MPRPLSPWDDYTIRRDMQLLRGDFRDVYLVSVTLPSSSGSFEPFTGGPIDVSRGTVYPSTGSPVYSAYRTRAHIKIVQPTTIVGLGPAIPGVQIGDYLMYFSNEDEEQVLRIYRDQYSYLFIDRFTYRPLAVVPTGLTQNDEVLVHARKYDTPYRKSGL